MNISCMGIDLAKHVFQVHGVNNAGKVVAKRRLVRSELPRYFQQLPPCLIGMEACAGAHYWARQLRAYGHDVRLIPPQYVKPYVKGNKTDANDAAAICEAVSRPHMRFVSVKSVDQQVVQAEHRIRSRLIKSRTALGNEMRGLLAEFGVVLPTSLGILRREVAALIGEDANLLPARFLVLLRELYDELLAIDQRVIVCDRRLAEEARQDERVQRLMAIEGIGVVSATALVAAVGDAKQFKRGREFSSWLGIVPQEHSSGGKQNLGHISKRGPSDLRMLLIHGARAVLNAAEHKTDPRSQWVKRVAERRNRNIATVALANKNARIAWAILAREETYRQAA